MCLNNFILLPANGFVWNKQEFLEFLIDNQGKKITVSTHEEGVCLESAGIYKLLDSFGFHDVTIETNNALELHPHYSVKIQDPQKFFRVTEQDYQQYHVWNKNKIFGCLYNRPLWHRIGLAAEMQVNHSDISLINFRSNPHDLDQQQLFEIQQLFEQAPQSLEKFCKVRHQWPLQIETTDSYTVGATTNAHTNQLAKYYPEFLIDLVAETWTQGQCFFPTEKTVRAMLLKKPMIVMGPRDYFCYLRQMGFQTFYEFWDEDYDGFADGNRYSKILHLIHELSTRDSDELNKMYRQMQPILNHNYNLLINQAYNTQICHVE
jgi:hypothetical protein